MHHIHIENKYLISSIHIDKVTRLFPEHLNNEDTTSVFRQGSTLKIKTDVEVTKNFHPAFQKKSSLDSQTSIKVAEYGFNLAPVTTVNNHSSFKTSFPNIQASGAQRASKCCFEIP